MLAVFGRIVKALCSNTEKIVKDLSEEMLNDKFQEQLGFMHKIKEEVALDAFFFLFSSAEPLSELYDHVHVHVQSCRFVTSLASFTSCRVFTTPTSASCSSSTTLTVASASASWPCCRRSRFFWRTMTSSEAVSRRTSRSWRSILESCWERSNATSIQTREKTIRTRTSTGIAKNISNTELVCIELFKRFPFTDRYEYLRKIIHMPFCLPEPSDNEKQEFLKTILKNTDDKQKHASQGLVYGSCFLHVLVVKYQENNSLLPAFRGFTIRKRSCQCKFSGCCFCFNFGSR